LSKGYPLHEKTDPKGLFFTYIKLYFNSNFFTLQLFLH